MHCLQPPGVRSRKGKKSQTASATGWRWSPHSSERRTLILQAERHGDARFVVGASIFAATMILLYLSSTLYHALPVGKAKRVFRVIEHSAIFLLIAGTYTPFTLGVLRGAWGWTLLGIVWGLAAAGVALKVFNKGSHPVLSTTNYLMMGWLVVIAVDPMIARIPTAACSG